MAISENSYQNEREAAGITTSKGTTMLQDFIRSTKVATRGWLLQGGSKGDGDDEWGWGRLGEGTAGDREAEGQEQD